MSTKIISNRTSALFIQDISSAGVVKMIAENNQHEQVELEFSPEEIREITRTLAAAAMQAQGNHHLNASTYGSASEK